MTQNRESDFFSYEDASQDFQLTLTQSHADYSSTFTPFIETDKTKIIWGTNINVVEVSEAIKIFIRSNRNYRRIFDEMSVTGKFIFQTDCQELPVELSEQLEKYPAEVIPLFENSITEIYLENNPTAQKVSIIFRPFNIGNEISIRSIEAGDIDRIVKITGMINRTSGIIPEVRVAQFKCLSCDRLISVDAFKNTVNEPTVCECGKRFTMEIMHNNGIYTDKQVVKIQELPENIPEGATPLSITVICKNELVDELTPGSKVELTGILKAMPVKINPLLKKMKTQFRIYLECLSIKELTKVDKAKDYTAEIQKLRMRPDVYEILSCSIAPSICGLENVKKALLLQLFGGVSKKIDENTKLRGDINILLAGDPGISKSQLLSFINKIAIRSIYTSGRGSSAVGLTAAVSKDSDSGQFILEPGALVLSDTGVCCIDEFDKMNEYTTSVLHEVMEQQTVSIAKAGIITTLNARSSILASANPVESKYNIKKTIVENINLQPTLLSRFDIVALLIDKPDNVRDKKIAEHILDMYTGESKASAAVEIPLLKAYIHEAKKIKPVLTEDAIKRLSEAYVELRQLDNGKSITATTRQLESLIRLSEAHAKVKFSQIVEVEDVKEAIRLIKESLLLYAVDPRTGKIDMDMVITGISSVNAKLVEELKVQILKMVKKPLAVSELFTSLKASFEIINEALNELELEEKIFYDRKAGRIEKINKEEF